MWHMGRNTVKQLKQGSVALVLLGIAASGNAALLTWNLQATGPNDAVASGFLEFNAQGQTVATAVGDFDIKVSGGGDVFFSDFEFTPSNTNVLSFTASGNIDMQTKQPTATIDRFISVNPVPPAALTDVGGTVSITISETRIQGSTEFPINMTRSFDGIAVSAVPEASNLAFLATGLLVLSGLLSKRLR